MAINKQIKIQKLDVETEEWKDYYKGCAEVNKSSGREYFNAKTKITQNTYNFKVRYIRQLENIIFNTSQYRIIYKGKVFDIINVDDKWEQRIKLTFVGDCTSI